LLREIRQGLSRLWRDGVPPGSARAYGFALACVAVATLVRFSIAAVVNGVVPFALYYPAVLLATLVAGSAAGALASLLGAFTVWATFSFPSLGIALPVSSGLVSVVVYALSSGIIIWAGGSYRETVRRLREEQLMRQLLVRESRHRNNNTIAVVQAIVRQSLRDQPEEARKISGRIGALAATGDLLIQSEDRFADLEQVLRSELKPHGRARIALGGPSVQLPPQLAMAAALIFHELATNASKYGALSSSEGRLSVSWINDRSNVTITWSEQGGPAVSPPESPGFGIHFIKKIARAAACEVEFEFQPQGVTCRLSFPSLAEAKSVSEGLNGDRPSTEQPGLAT